MKRYLSILLAAVMIFTIGCKKDTTKEEFIANLAQYLENFVENVEILNPSKLISFKIGEDTFELDLKRKRAPKK